MLPQILVSTADFTTDVTTNLFSDKRYQQFIERQLVLLNCFM